MSTELKPRTIPDALGLTDRKYKAIYSTIEESLKGRSAIEALVDIKSMFTDPSELTFAVYAFSMKVGFAKAEQKFKDMIPQIAEKSVEFGQMIALKNLQEMERRGMIKIIDLDPENHIPQTDPSEKNIPDDILYGADISGSISNPQSTCTDPTTNDQGIKKKPSSNDEDRMYG